MLILLSRGNAYDHGITQHLDCSSIFCSYLAHFPRQDQKNNKNPPRKRFLIFSEMELSSSNIKKIRIFSQKKAFLIFQ